MCLNKVVNSLCVEVWVCMDLLCTVSLALLMSANLKISVPYTSDPLKCPFIYLSTTKNTNPGEKGILPPLKTAVKKESLSILNWRDSNTSSKNKN